MNKMKYITLIISLLIGNYNLFSIHPIDSLTNLLENSDEKTQFEALDKLCRYYLNTEPNKSLKYAENAYKLAQDTKNSQQECLALINMGAAYWHLNNYEKVLENNFLALKLSEKINFQKGIILSKNNIGAVYNELANFNKALENYLSNYNYIIENKLDTVFEFSKYTAICLNNIGQLYAELGDKELSIQFLTQSIEYYKKIDEFSLIIHTLINLGISYLEIKKYKESEQILFEAIELSQKNNLQPLLAGAFLNLGRLYIENSEYEKSIKYLKDGMKIANELKLGKLLIHGNNYLSLYYEVQNKFDTALYYHKKFKTIADSLLHEDLNYQIANMQVRYESEKKNLEIEMQKKTILRKNIIIALLFFSSLIISVLMFLFLKQYRDKKIAYDKIVQQNFLKLKKENDTLKTENGHYSFEKINFDENKIYDEKYVSFIGQFEKQKPYLDTQLTIETLAKQFDTNRTYLSQLINNNTNLNFNHFINKYRVNFAINMLSDPKFYNLSIEGIAQNSGFNSKSTFNSAFKNIVGITPSYFRDSIKTKQNIA